MKWHKILVCGLLLASVLVALPSSHHVSLAQGQTTVTFTSLTLSVGESGVVDGIIDCASATGCSAFDITIRFDPSVVRVDSAETGPYLGSQFFVAENAVDNDTGAVQLAVTAMGANPDFGEPVLLRLHVTGLAPGLTALNVSNLLVADLVGNPLEAVGMGGAVFVEAASLPSTATPFPTYTPAPPSSAEGKIVFGSDRDGDWEIYVMDADGSNQLRLTSDSGSDRYPSWSPDGSQITFRSDRDGGDYEIFVMNADGSNQRNLTNNSDADSYPAWSPDGSAIAFGSDRDGDWEVYVMNANGSNVRRLTYDSALDSRPAWSPDSAQIAFVAERDGDKEIYVMNADGSNQRRLTNNSGDDSWPVWSPDGAEIAFSSDRDGANEVYIMSATGSNVRRLTRDGADYYKPTWSPDGAQIAFGSDRGGDFDIYVINVTGSNVRQLTTDAASDRYPDWLIAP
jgi:dipeptidyl aminopeptidase/acylaminoacyl peptidase